MNRNIFMKELRELLSDIPSDEREEALAYYESYFDEAGVERESEVIRELESPQKVAQTIKEDLFEQVEGNPNAPSVSMDNFGEDFREERTSKRNNSDKTTKYILIAIAAILTFPIWIGLVAGAFGLLVGGIAAVFGILVGIIAGTGAIIITGFGMACVGFAGCITGDVAVGILLIGVGLIILAIGVLALLCVVWVCVRLLPMLWEGITTLWNRVFHKRKETAV